jgi:TPR repeat protein
MRPILDPSLPKEPTPMMMRAIAAALTLGAAMSLPAIAHAAVNDGIAAHGKGDYATAFKEFSAAANAGDAAGKHMLASLYYTGQGVGKDLKKAVALFTEAAQAGYTPSMANLGLMYSKGDGVPQDLQRALHYATLAAEKGDVQAQFNLGQSYRKGAGVPQSHEKAALWYRKAAEAGSLAAQNEYGLLFAQGHGVPQDYVQAFAWIDMPASAGEPQAIKNRAQLLSILDAKGQVAARKLAAEYAARYGKPR